MHTNTPLQQIVVANQMTGRSHGVCSQSRERNNQRGASISDKTQYYVKIHVCYQGMMRYL